MSDTEPKATGGTFTVHTGGHTSSPIPYDADIDVLRAQDVPPPPPPPTRADGLTAMGGWCAPSEAVYDLFRLPEIGIARDGAPYPRKPITPAPPPTLRERWRKVRERVRAARYAARKAWKYPDGYWEVD